MIRAAAIVLAALLPVPALACAWPSPEIGGVQNADTRALEAKVAGETLAARMRHHQVPGVGVALFRRGTLAWARGWGVRDVASCTAVTAATAFQAASISKTVAALTIVRLAERGALDLDADVSRYLKSWRPPPGLTLRALLGHTAGLGVHGFPGYPQGAALPTLPQILDGTPAANTEAVRPVSPRGVVVYSGGGYEVAELAVTASAKGKDLVWAPGAFRYVMMVLRHIPRPIFRKLPI